MIISYCLWFWNELLPRSNLESGAKPAKDDIRYEIPRLFESWQNRARSPPDWCEWSGPTRLLLQKKNKYLFPTNKTASKNSITTSCWNQQHNLCPRPRERPYYRRRSHSTTYVINNEEEYHRLSTGRLSRSETSFRLGPAAQRIRHGSYGWWKSLIRLLSIQFDIFIGNHPPRLFNFGLPSSRGKQKRPPGCGYHHHHHHHRRRIGQLLRRLFDLAVPSVDQHSRFICFQGLSWERCCYSNVVCHPRKGGTKAVLQADPRSPPRQRTRGHDVREIRIQRLRIGRGFFVGACHVFPKTIGVPKRNKIITTKTIPLITNNSCC